MVPCPVPSSCAAIMEERRGKGRSSASVISFAAGHTQRREYPILGLMSLLVALQGFCTGAFPDIDVGGVFWSATILSTRTLPVVEGGDSRSVASPGQVDGGDTEE